MDNQQNSVEVSWLACHKKLSASQLKLAYSKVHGHGQTHL